MNADTDDVMTIEEARSRWPAEQLTTFDRMRDAARIEASRIESSQMARMVSGIITAPAPGQVRLRDDFVGLVRLIDRITADSVIMDRLKK